MQVPGNTPKKGGKLITFVAAAVAVVAGYFLVTEFFVSKSAFDTPTKANPKIAPMFDKQLQVNIDEHEQSSFHPGYLPSAKQHVADYLKTITKIESYSRYGVESSRARNTIEVKLTFNDGSVAEEVYTGSSSSHIMPPPLLMR